MNREEFLKQLHTSLNGKVSERIIAENLDYYRSYINSQVEAGQSEADVMRGLGDPRLLAKTIEQSSKYAGGAASGWERESSSGDYQYGRYSAGGEGFDVNYDMGRSRSRLSFWITAAVVVLAAVVIIWVAVKAVVFLMPVIIVMAAAVCIYRFIKSMFG